MPNIRKALANLLARLNLRDPGSLSVTIGGEHIAVRPLGLESALEFMLLLAPYVGSLDRHWPMLAETLAKKTGPEQHGCLGAIIAIMSDEVKGAPGDITRAVALMLGRDPEWVARYALPEEIVTAIPVLNEANDFNSLFNSLRALGLALPKGNGDNGSSR